MYDPTIGRWLSQDPLGFKPGDANLYRYAENQPTILTDPSGLSGIGPNFKDRPAFEINAVIEERLRNTTQLNDFELGHFFRAVHDEVAVRLPGGGLIQFDALMRREIDRIRTRAGGRNRMLRDLAEPGNVYAVASATAPSGLPGSLVSVPVLETLAPMNQFRILLLIRNLDDPVFRVRQIATQRLRDLGPLSLPFLAQTLLGGAVTAGTLERLRRVEGLLDTMLGQDWHEEPAARELRRVLELTEPGLAAAIGAHARMFPGDYPPDLEPVLRRLR